MCQEPWLQYPEAEHEAAQWAKTAEIKPWGGHISKLNQLNFLQNLKEVGGPPVFVRLLNYTKKIKP